MEARLAPRDHKYYTTEIEIRETPDSDWTVIGEISLAHWQGGKSEEPSVREEWLREHPEEICDGHFENQATYELAMQVVSAINGDVPS